MNFLVQWRAQCVLSAVARTVQNTANFNGYPLKLAYLCDGFSMCYGGPQCVLSAAVRTVENTALHPVVITAHPVHGQGLEVSLHTDSIRMGETMRL